MFFKKIKNKNKGLLIVEIVVATSIIIVFVLIVMNVAQKSVALSRRAVRIAESAFLLEEGAESVKIFRDNNTWANFTTFFDPSLTYCLPGTVASWTSALSTDSPCTKIGVFTRVINVANVNRDPTSGDIVSSGGVLDSGTKLFTIMVSWPEGGNTIIKILKFYISDLHS